MSNWQSVYKGGHHTVWCNGQQHVYTYGGYTGPDYATPCDAPEFVKKPKPCDCERWGNVKRESE